ncbi:cytosolic 5'-nucleotidase 1A-like [Myxocyprinus asiaticus]|uniref:cytosolic 5'-nucleotidase 1A-like n=1 Tax=Myxocyprinus asiaticus TaxID=70543 RepID=UPI002221E7B8|nr:cytosolic 5'-nucleotidase 1A-like [Myxocyprinus asiaticus]
MIQLQMKEKETCSKKPTLPKPQNAITIAMSSRALFNMDLEQEIYEQRGMEEYLNHQSQHEIELFAPGPALKNLL